MCYMSHDCYFCFYLGQLVFDVLGQTEIQGARNVTTTLSEALVQLGKQGKDVRHTKGKLFNAFWYAEYRENFIPVLP